MLRRCCQDRVRALALGFVLTVVGFRHETEPLCGTQNRVFSRCCCSCLWSESGTKSYFCATASGTKSCPGITSRTREERWLGASRVKSMARRIREQTVNVPKKVKQWNLIIRQSALDQALPHWDAGSKLKPVSEVASHGAFIALRTQGALRKVLVLNFF